MKLVYSGPQPTRTVVLGPGEEITVTRGEAFDVPAEVGEKLVRQRHFSASTTTRKKTTRKKAAAPPPAPPADAANPDAGEAGGQKEV